MGRRAGWWLLVGVLLFLVVLAAWGAWASWRLAGDAPMTVHGYAAVAITVLGVGGLTAGLIRLAFHSSRHGYDDEQDYEER